MGTRHRGYGGRGRRRAVWPRRVIRVCACCGEAAGAFADVSEVGLCCAPCAARLLPAGLRYGAYVRGLRERAGKGLREVAAALGVSPGELAEVEGGRRG